MKLCRVRGCCRLTKDVVDSVRRISQCGLARQYYAAVWAALSAMVAGSAFAWVTQILVTLTSPESEVPMTRDQSSWMVAMIEVGNLLTPLPTGFLVDIWGRWRCLMLTAPLYILSWVLVIFTRNVHTLYISRFIQGIGMGVVYVVLPLYLGEIAEPRHRGTLSTMFEVMWYLGSLLQYCVAPMVSYHTLAIISLTVPVVYFLAILGMPETPYFLLLSGDEAKAAEVLLWLRGGETSRREVEAELKAMKASVDEDLAQKSSSSWFDLVATATNRRCLLVVQVVALLEVLMGIPAILSYVTESLITTEDDSFLKPDQYTVVLGVAILVSSLISAATVDHLGRRPIILSSCLGASVCLFISGGYFYLHERHIVDVAGYQWAVLLAISCYGVILSSGVGALSTTIESELFPTHNRGLANGVITMTNNVVCFMSLKLYQDVQDGVGVFLNFWIYAGFGLLGAVFLYHYLPETKGQTFAEIQHTMDLVMLREAAAAKTDKPSNLVV
ncbi:facilitated trehalose transporter Tret1-like [Macrosteles quadrilineatus]|uniref:facilitated trehalose transporter Tret1-like n=1 Tax=Macrosteles quadrilineatus TaxID=74068 RepID=UPI0023E20E96|nr:facilitated trehalose transporter Tret1-like [Macrosteles quadrilineatus]